LDFLNRVFKLVLLPGSIQFLIVGLVIGVVLLYGRDRARRLGRYWLTVLATAYLIFSLPLGADVLVWGLARGFGSIASASEANGATAVVVLTAGSPVYSHLGREMEVGSEATALRALEAARIYHMLSSPLVVASGGLMPERTRSEAALLADALVSLGVPADRIIQETRSMSTREHALFVPPLLRKHGVERFVLVTSPTHIRRAVRAFEAQGLRPVASMSAMRSSRPGRTVNDWWPGGHDLSISAQAIYNHFGLVYYWSRGWI
jgi:uncharacterized SAM-binding protein YcdF (DUF218 family)